ncbi:hypothetical protein HDG39_007076, partial [Paraburkholderia sp. WSM4180]|nr:hypothetical protein [Paraburkholderia sp. WSM4180]
ASYSTRDCANTYELPKSVKNSAVRLPSPSYSYSDWVCVP